MATSLEDFFFKTADIEVKHPGKKWPLLNREIIVYFNNKLVFTVIGNCFMCDDKSLLNKYVWKHSKENFVKIILGSRVC